MPQRRNMLASLQFIFVTTICAIKMRSSLGASLATRSKARCFRTSAHLQSLQRHPHDSFVHGGAMLEPSDVATAPCKDGDVAPRRYASRQLSMAGALA